jgi:hypothetical protein
VSVGGGQLQLGWSVHSGFLQAPLAHSKPAGHGLMILHASLHSGGGGGGVFVGGGGGVFVGGGGGVSVGGGGGVSVGGGGGVLVGGGGGVLVGGGQLQLGWSVHWGFLHTPLTHCSPAAQVVLEQSSLQLASGGGQLQLGWSVH